MIGKLVRELVKETVALPANVAAGVVDGMEAAGKALEGQPEKKPRRGA